MSLYKANLSSQSLQRAPLKLEPLIISQKDKDFQESSHQQMQARLNSQKILFIEEKENDRLPNSHQRMFYSPQSRKLPKINLTDSQLKMNSINENSTLIGRSINIINSSLRNMQSLERQHSDTLKFSSNMLDQQQKLNQNSQSLQGNTICILQDSLLYPSNEMQDSVIKGFADSSSPSSKIQNKVKVKSVKGYESQLLTSLIDIPRKLCRLDLSPKRLPQIYKMNLKSTSSRSSDHKKSGSSHQKESILQTYRYDKDLVHIGDDKEKLHIIHNKNKISKDLHTKMLVQFTQLENLYVNQMSFYDRLGATSQKHIPQQEEINLQNSQQNSDEDNQYGEYQSILEKFQVTNLIEDENIELSKYQFESTICTQAFESLLDGCGQSIKQQLSFLNSIFNRILYSNSNLVLHNHLYTLLSKPSFLDKPVTYTEGLYYLIDYVKQKESIFSSMVQKHTEEISKYEERISKMQEKYETLQSQCKNFEDRWKKQEEELKQYYNQLLEEVEQKKYNLESDMKKQKEALKIELAQMERDYKDKINDLQSMLVQKLEETQFYKAIYDKQEQRYARLKIQYDVIFDNQAQSVKQLQASSKNIHLLQDKLNLQDSQMRSISKKSGVKFQELTPRPSFKNVDILLDEYSKMLAPKGQANKLELIDTHNQNSSSSGGNLASSSENINNNSSTTFINNTSLLNQEVNTNQKSNEEATETHYSNEPKSPYDNNNNNNKGEDQSSNEQIQQQQQQQQLQQKYQPEQQQQKDVVVEERLLDKYLEQKVSTQTKINEINEFISQLVQQIKKLQQDVQQLQPTKPARGVKNR